MPHCWVSGGLCGEQWEEGWGLQLAHLCLARNRPSSRLPSPSAFHTEGGVLALLLLSSVELLGLRAWHGWSLQEDSATPVPFIPGPVQGHKRTLWPCVCVGWGGAWPQGWMQMIQSPSFGSIPRPPKDPRRPGLSAGQQAKGRGCWCWPLPHKCPAPTVPQLLSHSLPSPRRESALGGKWCPVWG